MTDTFPRPTSVGDLPTQGDAPPSTVTQPPAAVAGFDLHECIGVGGMGEVYRATDRGFGRDVAVKVLKAGVPAAGRAARRFLDEARITGQLQHPGIPAAYHIGTLPDSRPFLAMKLIRGQTLAELLKGGADRGRLVAAFEGVCQAVGYAHSRGVIHRDLKPANVMVGAFGEVQVMDWGLAKELTPVSREAESSEPSADALWDAIEANPQDPEERTRAGAVLGTPTYMAPEQARGEPVDERADVFGLGAVLCALLTGRPPFAGEDGLSTLRQAADGDLSAAAARLDGCGAEPELVALCRRCLSAAAADRPADAGAVAAAVAALRAAADDRARAAEVDRGRAEVRRRLTQRAAVVVAAVLLAGVVATVWQWQRVIAQEAVTATALRDRTTEFNRAEINLRQRDAERIRTVAALRKLTEEVVTENITRKPVMTDDDRRFLREVLGLWQTVADSRGDDPDSRGLRAEGAFRVGNVLQNLGDIAEAESAFRTALSTWEKLAADFPAAPEHRREVAATQNNLGLLLADAGRAAEAEQAYKAAAAGYGELMADFPTSQQHQADTARVQTNLGRLLASTGRAAEAA